MSNMIDDEFEYFSFKDGSRIIPVDSEPPSDEEQTPNLRGETKRASQTPPEDEISAGNIGNNDSQEETADSLSGGAARTIPSVRNKSPIPVRKKSPKGSAGVMVTAAAMFFIGLIAVGIMLLSRPDNNETQSAVTESTRNASYSEPASDADSSTPSVEEAESSGEDNPASGYSPLELGSEGENVRQMQLRLVTLGYIDPKSCTGYFGKYTKNAVKKFQQNAGLNVTGTADSETLRLLYSDNAPKA